MNQRPEKSYKPSDELATACAKEIREPYPQLELLSRERTRQETDVSWVILNNQYILSFVQHKPYLINLLALHQHAVRERLAQQILPWAHRPLLVPIRYSLPQQLAHKITELSQRLEQLGIRCELTGIHEVLIRTIPVSVPYLDLRLFLDTVSALDQWSLEQLSELMSQSQVFDPRLLSREEKIELEQVFVRLHGGEDKREGLFKVLTIEHCQSLLHV